MRKLVTIAVTSIFFGCATPGGTLNAHAAAPRAKTKSSKPRTDRLTAEIIADLASVSSAVVSPNGKSIAYTVRTPPEAIEGPHGARTIIWVTPSKGGTPRRFSAAGVSSRHPRWSDDGKTLAFLSKRSGDAATQIYLVPSDGGEARVLTSSETGIATFEWSPSGKEIAYVTAAKPTAAEEKSAETGFDPQFGDVHGTQRVLLAVDVKSGVSRDVLVGKQHVGAFAWSPSGDRLVVRLSDRADIDATMMYSRLYTVAATGGATKALTDTEGKLGAMAWSPDGKTIAFLGAADIHDPTAGVLFVVPAQGGTKKALTADYEGTGQWLRWLDSKSIAMLANEGTATPVHRVGVDGSMKSLAKPRGICRRIDISTDGKTLVAACEAWDHPGELFVGSVRSGKLTQITQTSEALDGVKLGAREIVRWNAEDGLEIEGVLTKPVDYAAGKRYPLAILVHGGPEGVSLNGWNTRGTYPVQLFAANGYVVLEPNYRGSQGRGVAFGKADQKDLGGKEFTDVLAGIDKLAADGLVDPDRVGMGGWSYGGYFSGLAATKHTARFKAAMVGAAITNWVSFTGTTEIEHENSLVHWDLWPYDHYALVWDRSPMAHAQGSKTATMIVHGSKDTRVPPGQAYELYRALRHSGTSAQLVMYPREGHGLGERAHQIDFATRFVEWFDTHVKG
ncbi:MAG: S9 family peptidase [Nannocystaceae bacterium]|nr:S9 family peptidase [Nannocystaceae bacterium]